MSGQFIESIGPDEYPDRVDNCSFCGGLFAAEKLPFGMVAMAIFASDELPDPTTWWCGRCHDVRDELPVPIEFLLEAA